MCLRVFFVEVSAQSSGFWSCSLNYQAVECGILRTAVTAAPPDSDMYDVAYTAFNAVTAALH